MPVKALEGAQGSSVLSSVVAFRALFALLFVDFFSGLHTSARTHTTTFSQLAHRPAVPRPLVYIKTR